MCSSSCRATPPPPRRTAVAWPRGRPVGPVRAQLTDPSDADLADLHTLLAAGLDLVGAAL
jgi:5-dehydro-4-deoxyglucarate dehydratase